jgi:hypothetical protein
MEIVIVSPESRRRDNLLSMLESIVFPSSIKMVEVCSDVKKIANPANPAIVFVDYREPELVQEKEISSLIMNFAVNYVVLLISHNGPDSHFTHYSSCELVYDEVNIEMLTNLIKNIQLKMNLQNEEN